MVENVESSVVCVVFGTICRWDLNIFVEVRKPWTMSRWHDVLYNVRYCVYIHYEVCQDDMVGTFGDTAERKIFL